MTLFARARSFVTALVTGRRLDRDMDEEWRFHVETRADGLAAEGLSREEALRRARLEFGDPLRWKEAGREARGVIWIHDLIGDLQYGVRQLRRTPVFAATAIVTLALGIGANTLAFSILHGVLVRELPYRDPGGLVVVWFTPPNAPDGRVNATLQNYFAVRDRSQSFESVGSSSGVAASITVGPDDVAGGEPVAGQRIYAALPPVLGVAPLRGTWFSEADDPPTAARKVVLSHGLWQRRFGGMPDVVGQSIRMDGAETTVVGVMPAGFEFFDAAAQFWTPSRWSDAAQRSPTPLLRVAARLKPGVTVQQAQAEMDVLAATLARESPETNEGWRIRLEPIHEAYTYFVRAPLLVLQGVVAVVLLIACANVAGLLLAQASGRQRELALRCALGSSRSRIVRQLVTESLLLSCIGGVLGVALAVAGLRLFMALEPATWLPRAGAIALDGRVLGFAGLAAAVTGMLVGLLPSWRVSRPGLITAIKGSNAAGGGVAHQRLRGALVIGQIALAMVLLIAAGLLVNTFVRLSLNRPGIDTTNLLAFQMRLPRSEFVKDTGADAEGFFTLLFSPRTSVLFDQIQERLAAVPGVQSVSASVVAPATLGLRLRVTPEGRPQSEDAPIQPGAWFPVSTDYFKTLRIPVLRGREFTVQDSLASTQVAIVNETLARTLWPGEDPVGRGIDIDFINDPPREVIGVVADVRETNDQVEFAPHVFVPTAQLPLASRGWFLQQRLNMTYLVRTATDPLPLVGTLRTAVGEVYRYQPIFNIRMLEQSMAEQLAQPRLFVLLLGTFAGIAASLALVGVYGLVAYGVGQRTREIGIRRALGASAGTVLRLVLHQGLILTSVGAVIGVTVSLAATRILESVLWGVSPTDPVTFALVVVGVAAAALLACYLPARRALAINPLVALRTD